MGSRGVFNIPGPAGWELRVHRRRGVAHGLEGVAALTSAVARAPESHRAPMETQEIHCPVEERASECAVVAAERFIGIPKRSSRMWAYATPGMHSQVPAGPPETLALFV